MKITRTIPARKDTLEIVSYMQFLKYGLYRDIMKKLNKKLVNNCYWCDKKFSDDDQLHAVISTKGDHIFCSKCAELLDNNTAEAREGE